MISIISNKNKSQSVRVLIVEDEYILAINIQESLESLGYTVVDIADSAEEAIAKATELMPNLILMDIRLRGEEDGIQAAEEIWDELQIPIIYVTGHSDKSTVERATLTYPFGYILKPVREQELYVAIQTALNRYQHEQFLSSVLRGMGDAVLVVDAELRIKYMNQVAEGLTKWPLDDAKNRMLSAVIQLVHEETLNPVQNPIVSAIQKQSTVYLGEKTLLIDKNGTMLPIADSATPIRNNQGTITGAVMVFRDDTQRRLAEERNRVAERSQQLELQMAEIERVNQLKEEFLAATSHEMRTPLSNIKMAISMLENVLNEQGIVKSPIFPASAAVSRYLDIMRHECERELNLVDDLLNMRILDAQSYPVELTSIQVQSWLSEMANSFQEIAVAQTQTLLVNIAENLPPLVSDINILSRVVSELLTNACKYTPVYEKITLSAYLHQNNNVDYDLILSSSFSRLKISIHNSGIEIPLNEQSRIFEPFYRINQSKTKQQLSLFDKTYQVTNDYQQTSGTGLGLPLVKKLVEYLQGTIEVNSYQGGTIFTVTLPLMLNRTNQSENNSTF